MRCVEDDRSIAKRCCFLKMVEGLISCMGEWCANRCVHKKLPHGLCPSMPRVLLGVTNLLESRRHFKKLLRVKCGVMALRLDVRPRRKSCATRFHCKYCALHRS